MSGVKFNKGKAPTRMIPAEFIEGIAYAFAFGAQKYGENNFRLGLSHVECLDAVDRHRLAILKGEEFDPESGLPHWAHLGASVAMFAYMRAHHPQLDDLYELNNRKKAVTTDELIVRTKPDVIVRTGNQGTARCTQGKSNSDTTDGSRIDGITLTDS